MRIKAVFPNQRARPVEGVSLDHLKELATKVSEVVHYNGSDFIDEVSPKDLLRRLAAMPEGCEVAVMGGPNHSERRYPMPTSASVSGDRLILSTHYSY